MTNALHGLVSVPSIRPTVAIYAPGNHSEVQTLPNVVSLGKWRAAANSRQFLDLSHMLVLGARDRFCVF
jgi:hypothetical protein